jgi:3-deoxy-7-phosphoheptulonate synthase
VPNPKLLLRGYERAALTLNFVRSLVDGEFADLHHPEYWVLGFIEHSPVAVEYQDIVASIGDAIRFLETLACRPVGKMDGSISTPALNRAAAQSNGRYSRCT